MSYRRPNTCSYCWNQGHNKMGCPDAKAKAKDVAFGADGLTPMQQWEKYSTEEPHPSFYSAKRLFGWDYKVRDAVEIQVARQKRSRKVKKCVYCDTVGHNKRTCPSIKLHKAALVDANRNYRLAVVEKLNKRGFGIGAVFKGECHRYDSNNGWLNEKSIAMVTSFNLRNINLFSCINFI